MKQIIGCFEIKLSPSEIMEQNNDRKFDICLMNPPYGVTGNDTIHLEMTKKCIEIADKVVSIFPFSFIEKINHKVNNKFKSYFDKYLISVEEINSNNFNIKIENGKGNLGIYYLDNDKNENKIKVNYLNKEPEEVESLLNISNYSSYEKEIIEWLSKNDKQMIIEFGNLHGKESVLKNLSDEEYISKYKELLYSNSGCKKLKKILDENPGCFGLIVNRQSAFGKAKCFTSQNGQIYDNYEDFIESIFNRKTYNGCNILLFKSKKAAENAKIAINNPLIRFTFLHEQVDRSMPRRVYQYIPHIDWEDDRVKTDIGLLELCGCPKEKAEEYALYCKEIIEKVDNK